MYVSSSIGNISQIPARSHSSLQNLNNNDHPWYNSNPQISALASFTQGLDASKTATPAVGNVYWATDSLKLYICYVTNVWQQVETVQTGSGASRGAIVYKNATRYASLPAGTAGQVLSSGGAAADPSWITLATSTILIGSGAGAYATAPASLTDVDATNLKATISGLSVGTKLLIRVFVQYQNSSNTGTALLQVQDVTNSVAALTIAGGNGPSTLTQFYQEGTYVAPSTSIQFSLQWQKSGNGVSSIMNSNTNFASNGFQIAGAAASVQNPASVVVWIQTIV